MKIIDGLSSANEWLNQIPQFPAQSQYLAFYSSWGDVLSFEPRFMMAPLDDHLVHRGDGVFEAMRLIDGTFYLEKPHLDRLFVSSQKIGIQPPKKAEEISNLLKVIAIELYRRMGIKDAAIRIFVSRGPGGFSTDPRECVSSQLYIVFMKFNMPPIQKYTKGVVVKKSRIPVKPGFFATVKACNYLPNVLQKMEAIEWGCDFTLAFDNQGYMAEGPTENMVIVDKAGCLVHPPLVSILRGTTMVRVFELAQEHKVCPTQVRNISEKDLAEAREMMVIGTTLDVQPIVTYEDRPVGEGTPGPVATRLLQLLRLDQGR